jgi:hypothetical protein
MKPNFKDINIKSGVAAANEQEWAEKNGNGKTWLTPELIPVKPVYTKSRPRRHGTPELCSRYRSLPSRALLGDVRHATLDHPPVCRFLNCRRIERFLSP